MASANGDNIAKPAITPRELFRKLFGIAWIKNDPIMKVNLREIVIRWFEAKRLLEESNSSTDPVLCDKPADSSPKLGPEVKRSRASSEESLVDVKSESVSESDDSPKATPEEPTGWECKRCTFVNEDGTACVVCGWFKARSVEATGTRALPEKKKEYVVEEFIKARNPMSSSTDHLCTTDDLYSTILSRSSAGPREEALTGPSLTEEKAGHCTVWASPFNMLSAGQAQEEAAWMDALEKDVFAVHALDEELIFRKRFSAAIALKEAAAAAEAAELVLAESVVAESVLAEPVVADPLSAESTESLLDSMELEKIRRQYASACGSILATSFPNVVYRPLCDSKVDFPIAGVHSSAYLKRLENIHFLLVEEARDHYIGLGRKIICMEDISDIESESTGRLFFESLLFKEPKCDLNLHCLSQIEGDNEMDRFLLPAAQERARLVLSGLLDVWRGKEETVFVAARPPGHHCPSFEDRMVALSVTAGPAPGAAPPAVLTPLEKEIQKATGFVPRELGMGFCALNALAVAVRRFQQLEGESFLRLHGRSIKIAIVDLDIHAGNGTELVFRNSQSVLHVSFHRHGRIGHGSDCAGDPIMPGTHGYKDVGGVLGRYAKSPRGMGYSVNITLRKGDGNAEVMSAFEGVALPILQQFGPDIVLIACGFDGLKLSPVFANRWGEESCPGMDAEYTPSLYGYLAARIRAEVQSKIVAATEGGYDPLSVGLAGRSLVKGLRGGVVTKPPMRTFNSDWLNHLNNIFQIQTNYWPVLKAPS